MFLSVCSSSFNSLFEFTVLQQVHTVSISRFNKGNTVFVTSLMCCTALDDVRCQEFFVGISFSFSVPCKTAL